MSKEVNISLKVSGNLKKELAAVDKELGNINKELDNVNDLLASAEKGETKLSKKAIKNLKERQKLLKEDVKLNQDLQSELKEELGIISKLTKKMKDLEEAKRLATSTDDIAKLNKELSETQSQLDEASGSGQSFLDGLAEGPGIFGNMISGAKQFFAVMIANPVIAIITAVVAGLKLVYDAFVSTEEGANMLSEGVAFLKGLLMPLQKLFVGIAKALIGLFTDPVQSLKDFGQFLMDQVVNRITGLMELIPALGSAMMKVFSGDFSEATKIAGDALGKIVLGVEDVTDKLKDASDEALKYARQTKAIQKAENDLEKLRRKADVDRSKRLKDIEKLKLLRDDETKSIKDRQRANEEIIAIQQLQLQDELAIAAASLKNADDRLQVAIANNAVTKELLDGQAEALQNLNEVEETIVSQQAESQSNRIALLKEEYDEVNLLITADEERLTTFAKSEQDKYNIQKSFLDKRLKELERLGLKENKIYKDTLAEQEKASIEFLETQRQLIADTIDSISDLTEEFVGGDLSLKELFENVGELTGNDLSDTVISYVADELDKIRKGIEKDIESGQPIDLAAELLKISNLNTGGATFKIAEENLKGFLYGIDKTIKDNLPEGITEEDISGIDKDKLEKDLRATLDAQLKLIESSNKTKIVLNDAQVESDIRSVKDAANRKLGIILDNLDLEYAALEGNQAAQNALLELTKKKVEDQSKSTAEAIRLIEKNSADELVKINNDSISERNTANINFLNGYKDQYAKAVDDIIKEQKREEDAFKEGRKIYEDFIKEMEMATIAVTDSATASFNALGEAINNAFNPTSILAFAAQMTALGETINKFKEDAALTAKEIVEIASVAAMSAANIAFEVINQKQQEENANELLEYQETLATKQRINDENAEQGLISEEEMMEIRNKLKTDGEIFENKMKEKAFLTQRKNDIAQATMNGALATTLQLATVPPPGGFIAAAAVAGMTLAQVGMIKSQSYTPMKFSRGGQVPKTGMPSNVDSVNAMLTPGETVINSQSSEMFAPLLSAINGAGAGDEFVNVTPAPMTTGLDKGNDNIKVWVSENDITNTQNKVDVIDKDAIY